MRTILVLVLQLALAMSGPSASLPDFDAWDRVVHRNVKPGIREGIALHLVRALRQPPVREA